MAGMRLTTDLGADVYVSVRGQNPRALHRSVLDAVQAFREIGWRSRTVPPAGRRARL